jgi:hypothetical protein
MPSAYDRLFQPFDIAWPRLLPSITDRGLANDIARRKLADIVLSFEGDDFSDAEIAEAALEKLGIGCGEPGAQVAKMAFSAWEAAVLPLNYAHAGF